MLNKVVMFNAIDLCFLNSDRFESCAMYFNLSKENTLSFFLQPVRGKSKTNCELRDKRFPSRNLVLR